MRFHYFQSSIADISNGKNAHKRFDELTAALAEIGATVKWPIMAVHDEARIEIDCPQGREAEAEAILNRIFPQ
jgi:hypothetical protein